MYSIVKESCSAPALNKFKFKSKYIFPSWYSSTLVNLIKQKNWHRKKSKSSRAKYYRSRSVSLRALVKRCIKKEHNEYMKSIELSIKNNPKRYWNYVNSIRKSKAQISTVTHEGRDSSGDQDIANAFANHFLSVYDTLVLDFMDTCNELINSVYELGNNSINISMADIARVIQRLQSKNNLGIDNIPISLIKLCPDGFLRPLQIIFNKSIESEVFPSIWKVVRVCLVPKKKNDNSLLNFRQFRFLAVYQRSSRFLCMTFYLNFFNQ